MKFLSPEWLWLFAPIVALAAAYVWVQVRRRRYGMRFASPRMLPSVAPRGPGWRRHVAAALILLSLCSGAIAMARPASFIRVPKDTATVMVCIDVSLSMQAKDIAPTRLKAAQAAATEFVQQMPPRFNVGLVSFAGSADLIVPPTTDHQQVVDGINQLQLAESTAIGEAIFTALGAIKTMKHGAAKAPPATIVLLSDGKTNSGRDNDSASSAASHAHVPVNTIAFGTDSGTVTINGDTEPVPVDRDDLHRIAQQTGGQAFDAWNADQTRQVYESLAEQIGYTEQAREITVWFIALCLALVFVASGASILWQQRIA